MKAVMTRKWTKGLLAAVLLVTSGCPGGEEPPVTPPQPAPVTPVIQTVDIRGGTLSLSNGASIQIPPEAIDSSVQMTMRLSEDVPPAELAPASPLYQFEPSGTVFGRRVRVSIPVTGDGTNQSLYWSTADGSGYEEIGGKVENGALVAEVLHFSRAFIGKSSGTRVVRGVNTDSWVTENQVKLVPQDLTQTQVSALVLGTDGKFTEYKGSGRADGTFTIRDVPKNVTFYLKRGTTYLVTDRDALDLGTSRAGRTDAVRATQATPLLVHASNLKSWQEGDHLEFFSTNANSWLFDIETYAGNVPAVGDTWLSGLRFYDTNANLIDGTKGDRAILAQLSRRTSAGGVPYTAMSRVVEFAPFTQVAGQELTIEGDMVEVSTANSISLDLKARQFGVHTETVAPDIYLTEFAVGVQGLMNGNGRGMFTSSADFLLMHPSLDTDLVTGTMSYGMPLNGIWGVSVLTRASMWTEYFLPGSTSSGSKMRALIETIDPVSGSPATMTIAPRLSPVRQPRLNGTSLFTTASNVGVSPVLTWEPPALGIPSLYQVAVRKLRLDSNGNTRYTAAGSVYTRDTQVRIPADLMLPGESYVLTLYAHQSATRTPDAPFRESIPSAAASVNSAIIQMAPAP